ncbi:hypothetical protein LQF12_00555 [Ruania suaedae]|uniref:hypothetical protein n=1 Tax=Ruania suaedae TaxID=2897774 RepID=UPI001E39E0B5|nr:hypothetical protein [Ruania suaedae]UFU03139.1 hypothetical protein LQF12_00555 [Ruania suaedae]
MRRPATVAARSILMLTGLALCLTGLTLLAPAALRSWPETTLPLLTAPPALPEPLLDLPATLLTALDSPLAPALSAVIAVVLLGILLGVLVRRVRLARRAPHPVADSAGTRVEVLPQAVADAAARACTADTQVLRARLQLVRRRRAIALEGTVTLAATADLARVSTHIDHVARQARDLLGAPHAVGHIRITLVRGEASRRIG